MIDTGLAQAKENSIIYFDNAATTFPKPNAFIPKPIYSMPAMEETQAAEVILLLGPVRAFLLKLEKC